MRARYSIAGAGAPALALGGTGLLLAACYMLATMTIARPGSDWFYYWIAARIVLEGASPYDPAAWEGAHLRYTGQGSRDPAFPYPPWTAVFLSPLGLFPTRWIGMLWLAGMIAGMTVALILTIRPPVPQRRGHALAMAVALCSGFRPFLTALLNGQVTALLTLVLLLAMWLARSSRWTSSGMALGTVIVKPQLSLVLLPAAALYFLRRRASRAIAGLIGLSGALVLLSAPLIPSWITNLRKALSAYAAARDHSPTLHGFTQDLSAHGLAPVAVLSAVVVIGLTLLPVVYRLYRPTAHLDMLVQAAVPASLVLAPFLWSYDHTLLLASTAVTSRELLTRPGRRWVAAAWGIVALAIATPWLLYLLAAHRGRDTAGFLLPLLFSALAVAMIRLQPIRDPGHAAVLH